MLYKMEAVTRTRKIGGSLVATIPRELVEQEGLKENQMIKIDVKKLKKSGFGLFKGLAPFTKENKFSGQLEDND